MELPAERDQGLGAGIGEGIDRPLEQAARAGGSRVGWTSGTTCDRETHGLRNGSAGGWRVSRRQALGGSAGLSFIR